jgi:hypothetical protein
MIHAAISQAAHNSAIKSYAVVLPGESTNPFPLVVTITCKGTTFAFETMGAVAIPVAESTALRSADSPPHYL